MIAYSKDISSSDIFINAVNKEGDKLTVGESKFVYTSLNFNGPDIQGNAPTLDQKFAYGIVEFSLQITRENDGTLSYAGQVGDVYDFDWKSEYGTGFQAKVGTGINNGAFIYQMMGAIEKYGWKADINGSI